jgi:hypothetical protein
VLDYCGLDVASQNHSGSGSPCSCTADVPAERRIVRSASARRPARSSEGMALRYTPRPTRTKSSVWFAWWTGALGRKCRDAQRHKERLFPAGAASTTRSEGVGAAAMMLWFVVCSSHRSTQHRQREPHGSFNW